MSRWRKPPRPVPQREKSLWQGCLYAYCAGWEKGFRGDGSLTTSTVEDQKKGRGTWVGSLDAANYQTMEMGRVLDEGLSNDRMGFTDINNYYDTNGFLSAFVCVRPEVIQNGEEAVFGKLNDPAPADGWSFTVSFGGDPNPNGWHFQIYNGAVVEFSVANTQNTAQSDVLVMTYDRVQLVGYINGARRGSAASAAAILQNNDDVTLFGDTVVPNFQGHIGAVAFWNRPLAAQEIQQLYADPYVMWRPAHREFMFGPGMVPAGGGHGTYFLIF